MLRKAVRQSRKARLQPAAVNCRADRRPAITALHRLAAGELAGHQSDRFLHVGEVGWGAALVNDSTYGHDVTSGVRADGGTTTTVRLSLLRAPRYPDPEADQGVHMFRYAFVPGAGIGDAVREGYLINLPGRRPAAWQPSRSGPCSRSTTRPW